MRKSNPIKARENMVIEEMDEKKETLIVFSTQIRRFSWHTSALETGKISLMIECIQIIAAEAHHTKKRT